MKENYMLVAGPSDEELAAAMIGRNVVVFISDKHVKFEMHLISLKHKAGPHEGNVWSIAGLLTDPHGRPDPHQECQVIYAHLPEKGKVGMLSKLGKPPAKVGFDELIKRPYVTLIRERDEAQQAALTYKNDFQKFLGKLPAQERLAAEIMVSEKVLGDLLQTQLDHKFWVLQKGRVQQEHSLLR